MNNIQNLACIQAVISPSDKRISLNKDILRGKKILSLFVFSSTEDKTILSPYKDEMIAQLGEIDSISLFANLFDNQGNSFLRDLSGSNFTIDTEFVYNNSYNEYQINRVLDFDKSFISYKGTLSGELNLLVFVSYQTQNFSLYNDTVNGSVTIKLPITSEIQDIRLSDVIHYTLKAKQIKEIIVKSYLGKPLLGYIDLFYKHGRIENLPTTLLNNRTSKQIVFDNLEIDFEKSYFRHRVMGDILDSYITFIY